MSALPLILQTEAAECGLACIAMVAGFHGYRTDLAALRSLFPISLKGATLAQLVQIARRLDLDARAVRLEPEQLRYLKRPAILHWNFNHFVVLRAVGPRGVTIHDPAFGIRKVALRQISESFTGVALELWSNPAFVPRDDRQKPRLRVLMGRVGGMYRSLAQILVLALAIEVFALAHPLFLQWTLDNVIVSADRRLLTTLALGFGLLMLMQQVTGAVRSWGVMYMSTALKVQWRANVFSHLMRLPVQYFERRHLGDVLSRMGAIDQIQRTLTTSFLEAILDGLMAVVALTMMFLYSAALGWIAVTTMVLYALGRGARYSPLRAATREQIAHAAAQQSHFLETLRGIKAIKLFQRHDERRSAWLALLVNQVNAEVRTQKLELLGKAANGVLFGLATVLVLWLGAGLVLDGRFSVGALIAFTAYKTQFDHRVSALIDKLFELKLVGLQAERLADIVQTEPEQTGERVAGAGMQALEPTIEVRGLRFRYSEQEPFVLDGVDFRVAAGESVAIVGGSGCGKTTLINVLLGVLPASGGEVRIGGVPLAVLGLDRLRAMVGTVIQDDVLFAGSIGDNISFFDPRADQEWMETCARRAAIHADIAAMPMRYNTLVSNMGSVLSGGQKQRILLARALYKRPAILLLDEATSHLDVERERQVNAAVEALRVTRVIVAHRPETIASAGRVITLRT
jgi:ATP-binding cassette subfamily B protein RaxB